MRDSEESLQVDFKPANLMVRFLSHLSVLSYIYIYFPAFVFASSSIFWGDGSCFFKSQNIFFQELVCLHMRLLLTKYQLDCLRLACFSQSMQVKAADGSSVFDWGVWGGNLAVIEYLHSLLGPAAHASNDFGCNAAFWAVSYTCLSSFFLSLSLSLSLSLLMLVWLLLLLL